MRQTVEKFGGIDILVNNASAISVTDTESTDMKRYDLMQSINTRGTYMCSKFCLPYLKKAKNPHILTISPPLDIFSKGTNWFTGRTAYTMAKYGMTLCAHGMSEEFRGYGVAVNTLWPRTVVATAAIQNLLGGDEKMNICRNPSVMGDSAYVILTSDSRKTTGNYFMDDHVLLSSGTKSLENYRCNPNIREEDLGPDGYC